MEVHDVSTYVHRNLPRPQFYVQDILPKQGAMMLFGSPKVGKSWLSLYLGMCIATGREFLGFRTEQAKVFIAQFEISPIAYYWRMKNMETRFTQANPIPTGMLFELSPSLMYIDEDEPFNLLSNIIRPFHPNVIILDCLASCFGGDENDSRDMARLIRNLSILKNEHEAGLVLVHHSRKSPTMGSFVDLARGQSRLSGWVDTLAYIGSQPAGLQLQIMARQASRELPNLNIRFNDYTWERR